MALLRHAAAAGCFSPVHPLHESGKQAGGQSPGGQSPAAVECEGLELLQVLGVASSCLCNLRLHLENLTCNVGTDVTCTLHRLPIAPLHLCCHVQLAQFQLGVVVQPAHCRDGHASSHLYMQMKFMAWQQLIWGRPSMDSPVCHHARPMQRMPRGSRQCAVRWRSATAQASWRAWRMTWAACPPSTPWRQMLSRWVLLPGSLLLKLHEAGVVWSRGTVVKVGLPRGRAPRNWACSCAH